MGEHRKQGKTFFVLVDAHIQMAIHRAPSGHLTCISYQDGRQVMGAMRITQAEAAAKMHMTVPELLEKFKLE